MLSATSVKERITTQAARLLARGAAPSIEAIVQAAGVSRTTFYRVFPSRAELFRALNVQPEPNTRQRVLDAALRRLQTRSLADLSMDELADTTGISRANLYRLFPGKAALFRAILLAYSPFEPVMALLDSAADRPPEDLIPELVRLAYRTVAGHRGVVRTVLLELTSMSPDAVQAFRETGLRAFGALAQYLGRQMAAGRLRRMHPALAVEALIGPVMLLVLGGDLLSQASPSMPAGEEAAVQLAMHWLGGLRAEG